MNEYDKLRIAMRNRLLGAAAVDGRYQVALDAFQEAETMFEGKVRKDGKTPVLMHPLGIMGHAFNHLKYLRHPAESLATAMNHDGMEDAGLTIVHSTVRFGPLVTHATKRLSKEVEGMSVHSLENYFEAMLDCPIATVIKGFDRINNQDSMIGVLTPEKQVEQVDETERYVLPMIKKARRIYSDQDAIYENIKLFLVSQVNMVRAIHG